MKLLFALLVVSTLMLKVEGADIAYDTACTAASDTCTTPNAECKDDGTGTSTDKCLCSTNYIYDGTSACKKMTGQACTEDADCNSGECTNKYCGGASANDAVCSSNSDCKSLNCKFMEGTDKCADAASATVVASLTLMLVTLVTTRFL